MIWIHGGSYTSGNNRINIPGTVRNFVSREVVVVSIQYRLGFLGFFTTFTEDFPPNLGMLDQVEAFRFVQQEISNFGGDPSRVTIWGESAGGASVSAHSYSPLSKEVVENIYLDPRTANDDHLSWLKFVINVGTAWFFTGFTAQDVELYLRNNNSNVFVYEFTYSKENFENTGYHPVQHSSELNWVFMSGWKENSTNVTEIQLANFFGESWTNFAKTGNPSTDNSWRPVTSIGLRQLEYYEINPNGGMRSGYRTLDRIQFNRILPIFVGDLPLNMPKL
uniref:Carboxylic ester hydrolase n=1 Tax=Acrobeloides nanus TaxID=290746 RepID=A0A914CR14_9BILA